MFDPLRDETLPDGTAALVVGGGFPEVYAAELAANEPLREQVAAVRRADRGRVRRAALPGQELDGQRRCAGCSTRGRG